MEKNITLEVLERFHDLINRYRNAYDDLEQMDALIELHGAINNAYEDKIIPEWMFKKCDEIFNDHMDGLGLRIDELQEMVDGHMDAKEQMDAIVKLDKKPHQNVDDTKNSDDALYQIDAAMKQYLDAYDENIGVLSAVDKFCAISDAINRALADNKLSQTTAVLLMEPLSRIKNNMYDLDVHSQSIEQFQQTINKELSRENKNDGRLFNQTGSVLGNMLSAAVNGIKTINKKIDENAERAADEYDKQQAIKQAQEHKMAAADTSQKPEDLMKREDKVQDKQNPKQEALLKLSDLYNKLISARTAFDKTPSSLEARTKADKAWDDFYFSFYRDPNLQDFKSEFNQLMDKAYNVDKTGFPADDIKKLIDKEFLKEFGHEVPQYTQLEQQPLQEEQLKKSQLNKKAEHKEQVKDVGQKPENLMKREDNVQKNVENQEQPLNKVINLVNKYEKIYREKGSVLDDEVIGVWKELTDSINYAVDNKLIPDDMANQLVDTHEFLRRNGLNSEKQIEGIGKIKQIVKGQSDIKQNRPVEKTHNQELEKNQQAKDVAQKSESLTKTEDKEIERQRTLKNFTRGTQNIIKMDEQREIEKTKENARQKNNELALAAYRRKILQGRKSDV